MDSLSIWQWLVVLLLIVLPVVALWLIVTTIRIERRDTSGLRDIALLTGWLRLTLYILAAMSCVGLFSDWLERELLNDFASGVYASNELAVAASEANDDRQHMVGIAQIAVYATALVLFLMWIYRANINARRLGAQGMRYSPGWSVGWFFIPVANLWKPLGVMREIWRASSDPANWRAASVPAQLGWWWACWIAANVASQVSLRLSLSIDSAADGLAANTARFVADGFEIPLCLLLAWIVRGIHERQTSHRLAQPALPA